MAAPTIEARTTTGTGAATSTFEASFSQVTGERVVVVLGTAAAVSITLPGGWTDLTGVTGRLHILYRDLTGSEAGSVEVSMSSSVECASVAYNFSGFLASAAPEVASLPTGSSALPNPPELGVDELADYRWVCAALQVADYTDDGSWVTGTPAGFSDTTTKSTGTGGIDPNCALVTADQALSASSLDPSWFTVSSSAPWTTGTFAILTDDQTVTVAPFEAPVAFGSHAILGGDLTVTVATFSVPVTFGTHEIVGTSESAEQRASSRSALGYQLPKVPRDRSPSQRQTTRVLRDDLARRAHVQTQRLTGTQVGDLLWWDGSEWRLLPVGPPSSVLTVVDGRPQWV